MTTCQQAGYHLRLCADVTAGVPRNCRCLACGSTFAPAQYVVEQRKAADPSKRTPPETLRVPTTDADRATIAELQEQLAASQQKAAALEKQIAQVKA